MNKADKIYVAGHQGLVGSALVRQLVVAGYTNLVTATFQELDLRDQLAVTAFLRRERPQVVILAAARVGGIRANMQFPADFIYDNLAIQTNVIHAAYQYGVQDLLFLGSSCIYPRECPQPIVPSALLTGPLEVTNESYAIAKIAGIKLCQAYNRQHGTRYRVAMPTNLYGPHDNFDLSTSHVLPALLAKFLAAKKEKQKEVMIWGTGKVRREFLYVDDLARALILLLERPLQDTLVNVGAGYDVTIADLAKEIAQVTGYEGTICFDAMQPEGTPRKLLDSSVITALGWHPTISLSEGIWRTMVWYEEHKI